MTEIHDQLKLAADQIDAQSNDITALTEKLAAAEAELTALRGVKEAAVKADVDAKEHQVVVARLAKTAADALYAKGMLSTSELRDQFASKICNPVEALNALTKAAEFVGNAAPDFGTVVPSNDSLVETSDDVWQKHANAALDKLPTSTR